MSPSDVVAAMVADRVDPTASVVALVRTMRALGYDGPRDLAIALAHRYRQLVPWPGPVELDPAKTTDREGAARLLGRSYQRVDQLRREGRLAWRTRADGSVAIPLHGDASIEARLRDERHGDRLPSPRRAGQQDWVSEALGVLEAVSGARG